MRVESSDKNGRSKIFRLIDSQINSMMKRNITYIVNPHSEKCASINLIVTGKKGTGQVDFIVLCDEYGSYECHSQGKIYYMSGISELKNIVKINVTRLETTLNKLF